MRLSHTPRKYFNIGPFRALGRRSKSFPGQAITTGRRISLPFILNGLRDGTRLALTKTDEVARNGVLQRITSARGFL
jgi:hypothetical protein